jgi:hypothetical protein
MTEFRYCFMILLFSREFCGYSMLLLLCDEVDVA